MPAKRNGKGHHFTYESVIYDPAPPKGWFLGDFMKLKTSKKQPFGGAGCFMLACMSFSRSSSSFCFRSFAPHVRQDLHRLKVSKPGEKRH